MTTRLEHKFLSVRRYTPLFIPYVTFFYACPKSVVGRKKARDGKPARRRTRIVIDSARKRNRKEVLTNYIKTRINIGHQPLGGIE